jgi:hypothetical protein
MQYNYHILNRDKVEKGRLGLRCRNFLNSPRMESPGRWNGMQVQPDGTTNSHAACSKPSQPQWSETCRPPVVVACLVAVGERRLVCTSTTGDSQHLGAEAEQRSLTYRHNHDERPGQETREADKDSGWRAGRAARPTPPVRCGVRAARGNDKATTPYYIYYSTHQYITRYMPVRCNG